ncbi:basic salivary proline-rich protein 4-like [Ictidomys tridecemlineatus]|nr:basic salivary proline-rich protein 4-like [Ictidomys tridecemlineatus]
MVKRRDLSNAYSEIYSFDSLSLGSHRRQRRRGGGQGDGDRRPAPDPHLPRPEAAPWARASSASRERPGRPAGGRRAPRRLGRAAGRRPSCRGRGPRHQNGCPGNRSRRRPTALAARPPSVYRPHHCSAGPLRAAPTCEAPEPSHKGGGTRHSEVPNTRKPPPECRPQRGPPPNAHTPRNPSPLRGDAGRPRHPLQSPATHPLSVGPQASPASPSPNSHTHTNICPSPTSFPRGRSPLPNTLDPTRRHKNTLPHSSPLAQKDQQQPFPRARSRGAAAADVKAPARRSCAPAAAATAPRASQSLALALASWRWGCRRCGGCCCAECC